MHNAKSYPNWPLPPHSPAPPSPALAVLPSLCAGGEAHIGTTRKFSPPYGRLLSSSCGGLEPFRPKSDFAGRTNGRTTGLREILDHTCTVQLGVSSYTRNFRFMAIHLLIRFSFYVQNWKAQTYYWNIVKTDHLASFKPIVNRFGKSIRDFWLIWCF